MRNAPHKSEQARSDRTKTAPRRVKRRSKGRTDWIVIVDVPKLARLLMLIVMSVLAVFSVLQVVKRVLPVKEFSVVGISVYETQEIVSAAGVKRGELLYLLDRDEVEARILEACPYLLSAEVKPVFPNQLRIEVEGRNARWYIDVSGTAYALDGELVVLDEIADTKGLTKLCLPHVRSVICGSVPQFGESEAELKKTLEIIDAIRQSPFQLRLTEVNVESRWDIRMQVDGVYAITVGDLSDLKTKLLAVEQILNSDRLKDSIGGEIDVSLPQMPAVKPIYKKSGDGTEA